MDGSSLEAVDRRSIFRIRSVDRRNRDSVRARISNMRWAALALVALGLLGCRKPEICGAQGQVDLTACAQYVAANDLERAKVRCDLALQYCPDDADVHTNLGLIAMA